MNGKLVPEDRRIYLCQNDELRWLGIDIEERILTCTNQFHIAVKRYTPLQTFQYISAREVIICQIIIKYFYTALDKITF